MFKYHKIYFCVKNIVYDTSSFVIFQVRINIKERTGKFKENPFFLAVDLCYFSM